MSPTGETSSAGGASSATRQPLVPQRAVHKRHPGGYGGPEPGGVPDVVRRRRRAHPTWRDRPADRPSWKTRSGGQPGYGGRRVVVDLTKTEFLACCGIGALAVVRTTLAASGRTLVVTGARGQVRRLLELCGEPPGDAVPVARASRRRVDRGSDRCRGGLLPGLHHLRSEDRHRGRPSRASVTPKSGL